MRVSEVTVNFDNKEDYMNFKAECELEILECNDEEFWITYDTSGCYISEIAYKLDYPNKFYGIKED